MNVDRIRLAANIFLIIAGLSIIGSILTTVEQIQLHQFDFSLFLSLALQIILPFVMWGFADATANALGSNKIRLTNKEIKEEDEILKHYTDGPNQQ